jgi:hypothetical protein
MVVTNGIKSSFSRIARAFFALCVVGSKCTWEKRVLVAIGIVRLHVKRRARAVVESICSQHRTISSSGSFRKCIKRRTFVYYYRFPFGKEES